MEAVKEIVDERNYDISSFQVIGHALGAYAEKCFPRESLIQLTEKMKEKMKNVRKVSLNKRIRDHRVSYMDDEGIIYITEKNKVITVFPNERIFVAKTFYANRRTGQKYL